GLGAPRRLFPRARRGRAGVAVGSPIVRRALAARFAALRRAPRLGAGDALAAAAASPSASAAPPARTLLPRARPPRLVLARLVAAGRRRFFGRSFLRRAIGKVPHLFEARRLHGQRFQDVGRLRVARVAVAPAEELHPSVVDVPVLVRREAARAEERERLREV